jgi:hypothetical protein
MSKTLFAIVLVAHVGCSNPEIPTAPTQEMPKTVRTSRVNPADLGDLSGLTLEHNPFDEDVSLCHTMQREYCTEDGSSCDWETDYYTVLSPEVCPVEPIP